MKSRPLARLCLFFLVSSFWGFMLFPQEKTHLVVKGETLYSIARHNGITLRELTQANGDIAPEKIRVGQKLTIPTRTEDLGKMVTTPAPVTGTSVKKKYIVKHGDTLYSIARTSGVELSVLLSDNKLGRTAILKIGQQLIVRNAKADTLSEVAANVAPSSTPPPLEKGTTVVADTSPVPSPNPSGDLSGQVTIGTSFQKTAYTQGASLNWPHPGERFTLNGKLPGILIKAQKGEVVKSVNSGKVVYSGPHSTFGHIVFVQSPDGFIYIYGGNESSNLKTGEIVHAGDIIGTVGITPGIQEPQVYFSIWKDGSYVNPASVLHS